MASLTAVNFFSSPLSAAWNPSVNIAVPLISVTEQATTGPVLTVNASNNGVAIWQGDSSQFPGCGFCEYIYASSYTFGTGWGPPVVISDTSIIVYPPPITPDPVYINQADPDIMMNDSGYAVAVWEGSIQVELSPDLLGIYPVILASSRASDGTWSPVQTVRILDTDPDFYPQNPAVSVNESGLAVALWSEERGEGNVTFVMASFLPFGGTWTTPVVLDTPGVFGVRNIAGDVELNDNGNAVGIWQMGRAPNSDAIGVATYDPLTSLWTTFAIDPNPGYVYEFDRAPKAAIDSNGNAVVVWNREYSSGVDYVYEIASAYFTYGSGWGPTVILDSGININGFYAPYVVMDHLGTATAVWGTDSSKEVFSSRLPLGGTWTPPELIGLGEFYPFSVQEAASVDAQGNVVAIIRNNDGILQSILRTVQGGWQSPENIFNDLRDVEYQNIGLGSCGFALALWQENGGPFIQGADNFGLANYSLPPANFVGTRCCEKFAHQTACLVNLSWDPTDCTLFYYIRKDGELIATIPAGGSTTFVAPVCSKRAAVYTLSSINIYGIEGPGVSITL